MEPIHEQIGFNQVGAGMVNLELTGAWQRTVSLPIVSLISLLVGLILAFVGAIQLKNSPLPRPAILNICAGILPIF